MSKFCRLLRWSSRGHLISRSARVYGEDRVVERWPATHTQVSWEHINKLTPIFVRDLHDLSMEYGSITIKNDEILQKSIRIWILQNIAFYYPLRLQFERTHFQLFDVLQRGKRRGFPWVVRRKVFKRNCFFSFLLNVMKEDRWFAHLTSKLLLLSYIDSVL